tara:strand:+ start:398 stop:892 length:495 start_codon:yes stop_codon:yes gene_type:complete
MIGLLIFGLVVLSTICLWILIEERKSPRFLIWFIPVLLVLVTSTYVTYTSILGFPKIGTPERGMYLRHYIDEPNWIYLWVLSKKNVPMSYQIVYSRKTHDSLEGVKGKTEEGAFMVLGEDEALVGDEDGEEGGKDNPGGGYTIGGDISFYEWDYSENMPQKTKQ